MPQAAIAGAGGMATDDFMPSSFNFERQVSTSCRAAGAGASAAGWVGEACGGVGEVGWATIGGGFAPRGRWGGSGADCRLALDTGETRHAIANATSAVLLKGKRKPG